MSQHFQKCSICSQRLGDTFLNFECQNPSTFQVKVIDLCATCYHLLPYDLQVELKKYTANNHVDLRMSLVDALSNTRRIYDFNKGYCVFVSKPKAYFKKLETYPQVERFLKDIEGNFVYGLYKNGRKISRK